MSRAIMLAVARSFNEYVEPENVVEGPKSPAHDPAKDGLRPGDDYNRRADWNDVIGPAGWSRVGGDGNGKMAWKRPGKDGPGISATTGFCKSEAGNDLLYVFSTNAHPFENGRGYSKFGAYAILQHRGDFQAASQALALAGWGDPSLPAGRINFANSATVTGKQEKPKVKVEKYSHDELMAATFKPLTWLVEGLLPDSGITILGGKKKLGKSWMCLQMAQAVAEGHEMMGRKTAEGGGRVVYLCLEDGGRRLQDRLKKQAASRGLSIMWYTSFPKLDHEGMSLLIEIAREKPKLIVIDTLAAAKSGKIDENASGPMADLGNALRGITQEFDIGLLITHHHGKFSYGDPGDDLRGSSALAAAADLNLGIYKQDDGYRLRGEGRDIEPLDLAMKFGAHGSWKWELIGDARVVVANAADQQILFALEMLKSADVETICAQVQKRKTAVNDRLHSLLQQKRVVIDRQESHGGRPRILYRLPTVDEVQMFSPEG